MVCMCKVPGSQSTLLYVRGKSHWTYFEVNVYKTAASVPDSFCRSGRDLCPFVCFLGFSVQFPFSLNSDFDLNII